MDSGHSLSGIATAVDGNGMMGGGSRWVILLLLVLFGAGGMGGFGGNRAAAADGLGAGFNFNGIDSKLNDITSAITTEGRTTDNAICQLGYQTLEQTGGLAAQLARCRCETRQAIRAGGEATRAMIRENEIQDLRDQVQGLQLNQALCGVPRVSPCGYAMYPTFPQRNTCNGACRLTTGHGRGPGSAHD